MDREAVEQSVREFLKENPRVVRRVRNAIAITVRCVTWDPELDRDYITTVTLTRLWEKLKNDEFDRRSSLEVFGQGIAKRVALEEWKRIKTERKRFLRFQHLEDEWEPSDTDDPHTSLEGKERFEVFMDVLRESSAKCRELFERIMGDMPYREIGELIKKSEGNVKVIKHRCVEAAQNIYKRLTGVTF